jgi:hypothetical protein
VEYIIGWLTFGIALLTYTLTVEPTMSFGIVGNTYHCSKIDRSPSGAPIPDDWRFFAMFASDIQNCLNGQYDVSLSVPLPFCFYFGLHQSS